MPSHSAAGLGNNGRTGRTASISPRVACSARKTSEHPQGPSASQTVYPRHRVGGRCAQGCEGGVEVRCRDRPLTHPSRLDPLHAEGRLKNGAGQSHAANGGTEQLAFRQGSA